MGRKSSLPLGLVLGLLFLSSLLPLIQAEGHESHVTDGRVTVVTLDESTTYETSIVVQKDDFILLSLDCEACTANIIAENENTSGSSNLILQVTRSGDVEINIESSQTETIRFTLQHDFFETHAIVRPSPQNDHPSSTVGICTSPSECMNTQSGTLASVIDETKFLDALHTGIINTTADEYMVVDANIGDTLEWQWLSTPEQTLVQVYFQNSTNEYSFNSTLSSNAGYSEVNGGPSPTNWWIAPDYGRFIVRISSPVFPAPWIAHAMIHTEISATPLIGINLQNGVELLGHGSTESVFDWNTTSAIEIRTPFGEVNLRVDQLLNGSWIKGTTQVMLLGESQTIYPYPGNNGGRIIVEETPVFALQVQATEYSDNNRWLEAPSYRPASLEVENSSWPTVNLTTPGNGQLTLAIHDTVDTYRFVVDGWEDSIHLVQFTITGNISGLQAQMWGVDQDTSEHLETSISISTSESLKVSLKVGRGTHYLQISHKNATGVTGHNWGNDTAPLNYTITPSYLLVDEGEEPWFPPSEDAVYWGGVARWVLGTSFLIPVLYLAVHLQRSRVYAKEIFSKKERLDWYRRRLDSGEVNIKSSQKDLVRALHAVAQLPWEDGVETWGQPALAHRTQSLDLAVWRVDRRMAKTEDAWPLVLGVHVIEGEWDLAAVRFDGQYGQAYTVRRVEPRFLFQGEEVFLDTLKQGNRMFVLVELEGNAPSVDIELNGRMNTVPFAARIPHTMVLQEEE